jgi:hypothetical protein
MGAKSKTPAHKKFRTTRAIIAVSLHIIPKGYPIVMAITLLENFRAVFYAPFYAASALGAFDAQGLEVKVQASPDAALTMQTLLSGAGDVSWGGPLRLMIGARESARTGTDRVLRSGGSRSVFSHWTRAECELQTFGPAR